MEMKINRKINLSEYVQLCVEGFRSSVEKLKLKYRAISQKAATTHWANKEQENEWERVAIVSRGGNSDRTTKRCKSALRWRNLKTEASAFQNASDVFRPDYVGGI